jgi:hypothetical protein
LEAEAKLFGLNGADLGKNLPASPEVPGREVARLDRFRRRPDYDPKPL